MDSYVELETLQQNITLNLQEIDAHIANTVDSAGAILVQMKRLAAHTREFSDTIQLWGSFFKAFGRQWEDEDTNEPCDLEAAGLAGGPIEAPGLAPGDEQETFVTPTKQAPPQRELFFTPRIAQNLVTIDISGSDGRILRTPLKQIYDYPMDHHTMMAMKTPVYVGDRSYQQHRPMLEKTDADQPHSQTLLSTMFNFDDGDVRVPFCLDLFPEEINKGLHASQIKLVYDQILNAKNRCIDQPTLVKKLARVNSEMISVYLDLLEQKNMIGASYDYETNSKVLFI